MATNDVVIGYEHAKAAAVGPVRRGRHHRSRGAIRSPERALPTPPTTGTPTFLFTDIEGSTARWENEREAMSAALARHDEILRSAIEAHYGQVFKTVGDAFCAVFGCARLAVAAALAAQRALVAEDWSAFGAGAGDLRVRMALHAGDAEQRGGDYFGRPVNRVARLVAAGHGGQVVLSEAAFDLVRDDLPEGLAVRDLGLHRLKDLVRPEHVYQLVAPDLPAEFPALRGIDQHSHNLPVQLTAFVGRETEMQAVRELLQAHRLVTLTGVGGTGKTRLALQVAAEELERFPDGVFVADLAPIEVPGLVPATVAAALSLREQARRPVLDTLVDALREKDRLLILDNCEHLVDACAHLADTILHAAPGVRLLATSREPLLIAGEIVFVVPPLPAPGPAAGTDAPADELAASVSQYDAVKLFVDRARAVQPDFVVTRANAPAVAHLCSCLDGIPLALELAAARLRSLGVEEISRRMEQSLRLLTGGSRTALPRQQTLRAAIDWSHDLLGPEERLLFARLAVFRGGWVLAAAEDVCGGDGTLPGDVLDLVGALVDKSLVVRVDNGAETRYRYLATVREYAAERLVASGDLATMQARHAAYFVRWSEAVGDGFRGPGQAELFDAAEVERDNLRAAMAWSVAAEPHARSAVALGGSLMEFWRTRGHCREVRATLEAALAAGAEVPDRAVYAAGLATVGLLALLMGDYAVAERDIALAVEIRRQVGPARMLAYALHDLASVRQRQGDYATARALFEESLSIKRRIGDPWGAATSMNGLGTLAQEQGRIGDARRHYEEALVLLRQTGDLRAEALARMNLANLMSGEGDYAAALALYDEALAQYRGLADRDGTAMVLLNLGVAAEGLGDLERSRDAYAEALAISRELGSRFHIGLITMNLGLVEMLAGDFGAARERLRDAVSRCRDLDAVFPLAPALESMGRLDLACTAAERAVRLIAAAASIRAAVGVPLMVSDHELWYDRDTARLRAELGAARFDAVWAVGQAMSRDEAVAEALAGGGG